MKKRKWQPSVLSILGLVCLGLLAGFGCKSGPPPGPAFDIPALLGQKLPAVEKSLGARQPEAGQPDPSQAGGESGTALFSKGDYLLRVEHLKRNGRITSFTLTFADPTRSVKEEQKAVLLEAGGLVENDPRYTIEPIEDPQKVLSIAGLRVTRAPVQHKVELRVKGTAVSNVRYTAPVSVPGEPASGETFMTVPPWNLPFTAATGAVIGIEAGPAQMSLSGEPPVTTVQIIVDGKVGGQFTSHGGTAHCEVELD